MVQILLHEIDKEVESTLDFNGAQMFSILNQYTMGWWYLALISILKI